MKIVVLTLWIPILLLCCGTVFSSLNTAREILSRNQFVPLKTEKQFPPFQHQFCRFPLAAFASTLEANDVPSYCAVLPIEHCNFFLFCKRRTHEKEKTDITLFLLRCFEHLQLFRHELQLSLSCIKFWLSSQILFRLSNLF